MVPDFSMRRSLGMLLVVSTLFVGALYWFFGGEKSLPPKAKVLRVLSYSAFVNSWGPGPAIADLFQKQYGIKVEFQDGGDAGLLIQRLKLAPADVVVGLDQLTLDRARALAKWRESFTELPAGVSLGEGRAWLQPDFLPFDWAPMSFVYRAAEINPPGSLEDLLAQRFKGAVALEDPRTSTPGLQFLFWVLDEFGVEEGFDFLARLKPSIHSVSGSWSLAYGLFTKNEARLAFSYLTSPIYHWLEEKNESYAPAVFDSGHPVQIEYAGVPETCGDCVAGELFALFLLKPEAQKIVMEKNYMLPMARVVTEGSAFERLPRVRIREFKSLPELLNNRDRLLERWTSLGL